MKNITVSVDEEVYHAARIEAAKRRTSVSALVRQSLGRLVAGGEMADNEDKGRQERESLVSLFERVPFELGEMPDRESLHER